MYYETVFKKETKLDVVQKKKWWIFELKLYSLWLCIGRTSYDFRYHKQIFWPSSNLVQEIVVLLPRIDCTTLQDTFILQMGLIACKRSASFLLSALSVFILLFLLMKGLLFTTIICCSMMWSCFKRLWMLWVKTSKLMGRGSTVSVTVLERYVQMYKCVAAYLIFVIFGTYHPREICANVEMRDRWA